MPSIKTLALSLGLSALGLITAAPIPLFHLQNNTGVQNHVTDSVSLFYVQDDNENETPVANSVPLVHLQNHTKEEVYITISTRSHHITGASDAVEIQAWISNRLGQGLDMIESEIDGQILETRDTPNFPNGRGAHMDNQMPHHHERDGGDSIDASEISESAVVEPRRFWNANHPDFSQPEYQKLPVPHSGEAASESHESVVEPRRFWSPNHPDFNQEQYQNLPAPHYGDGVSVEEVAKALPYFTKPRIPVPIHQEHAPMNDEMTNEGKAVVDVTPLNGTTLNETVSNSQQYQNRNIYEPIIEPVIAPRTEDLGTLTTIAHVNKETSSLNSNSKQLPAEKRKLRGPFIADYYQISGLEDGCESMECVLERSNIDTTTTALDSNFDSNSEQSQPLNERVIVDPSRGDAWKTDGTHEVCHSSECISLRSNIDKTTTALDTEYVHDLGKRYPPWYTPHFSHWTPPKSEPEPEPEASSTSSATTSSISTQTAQASATSTPASEELVYAWGEPEPMTKAAAMHRNSMMYITHDYFPWLNRQDSHGAKENDASSHEDSQSEKKKTKKEKNAGSHEKRFVEHDPELLARQPDEEKVAVHWPSIEWRDSENTKENDGSFPEERSIDEHDSNDNSQQSYDNAAIAGVSWPKWMYVKLRMPWHGPAVNTTNETSTELQSRKSSFQSWWDKNWRDWKRAVGGDNDGIENRNETGKREVVQGCVKGYVHRRPVWDDSVVADAPCESGTGMGVVVR